MLEWALRSFRNGYAVRPEFAISALIRDGHLEARQFGRKKYVLREDIQWFLLQQHLNIGKED